jgi:hypothetical protein
MVLNWHHQQTLVTAAAAAAAAITTTTATATELTAADEDRSLFNSPVKKRTHVRGVYQTRCVLDQCRQLSLLVGRLRRLGC